jgi:hypothetical protein
VWVKTLGRTREGGGISTEEIFVKWTSTSMNNRNCAVDAKTKAQKFSETMKE